MHLRPIHDIAHLGIRLRGCQQLILLALAGLTTRVLKIGAGGGGKILLLTGWMIRRLGV